MGDCYSSFSYFFCLHNFAAMLGIVCFCVCVCLRFGKQIKFSQKKKSVQKIAAIFRVKGKKVVKISCSDEIFSLPFRSNTKKSRLCGFLHSIIQKDVNVHCSSAVGFEFYVCVCFLLFATTSKERTFSVQVLF